MNFAHSNTSECPDEDILDLFRIGKLEPSSLNEVAFHVSSCQQCVMALEALEGGAGDSGLIDEIRACLRESQAESDDALHKFPTVAALSEGEERSVGASVSETEPTLPRQLGPYRLLRVIGRGGMGVVYEAEQVYLGRLVAVKMILAGQHASPEALQRFRTEGRACARLDHPNVVKVLHFDEQDGQPYFALELLEGGNLAARTAAGPLSIREAGELVHALALAVESAHQVRVLHRDLKPSNILFASDGTPKITDFGLAKLLDDQEGLTRSEDALGTPSYMAPEQAWGGLGDIGPSTDVYALGAILYEALTGRPPFRGHNKFEVLRKVRRERPVPPSRHRREIPKALEAICLKCLEKVPADRYVTVESFATDLELWLQNEKPRGTPKFCVKTLRWLRRRPAYMAVGLTSVVICLTAWLLKPDPDRILRSYEKELAAGRAVTLIGEKGAPKWSRWRSGESSSIPTFDEDGVFRIHAAGRCLLELLPEVPTDHYRVSMEVRHEKSNLPGYVGVFVGHQTFPRKDAALQFLHQVTFNDVRSGSPVPIVIDGKNHPPAQKNSVKMQPFLYSDEEVGKNIEFGFPSVRGSKFRPAGESKTDWRKLAVTVSPSMISASWDGQEFSEEVGTIDRKVKNRQSKSSVLVTNPFVQDARLSFDACGGVGLCVLRGTACFREVRVTPLNAASD